MPSPRRPLPRAVRLPSVLVAALLVAGGVVGACSSGGPSADQATAATSAVGSAFNLPDDAKSCLQEEFAANGTATRAMTATSELSSSQQEAVAKVLEACVTVDQWAQALAGRITNALPPADSTKVVTQVDCLTGAVTGLDETRLRALLVGLVVIGTAPQTGELAVQRGAVLNTLYNACSVTAGS